MTLNLLITGTAGLIGSRLIEWILENIKDVFIISIDDLSGGLHQNLIEDDRILFLKLNLCDKNHQKRIESEIEKRNIDYIWHASCFAAECLSPFIRQFNYINTIIPTAFLINMSIKYNIKRFVYFSSMAVYGNQNPPFDEDLVPKPCDPYGISKYACEMDLKVAEEQHGLEYCIIRPHNVLSRGQNLYDIYRNVIGIWMWQALHDKPFTIYDDGEQIRAFTITDNILPCLWQAAISPKAKNEIINLGGIKDYSINEISEIVLKVTGTTDVIHLEARHEVKNAFSTYKKSIELLDYKETVSLENGLKEMWEWCKTQPDIPRQHISELTELELETGLYSYWKK